ncbi:CDGSH iron-sulfur domain-containing protein [Streptomyces evansiae]|uniref:CDGSH iron-sulfur domain-containing protein n=1 Tax=Streptomyces evansiae TaxID=3075535 RepID=UPI0037DA4F4F
MPNAPEHPRRNEGEHPRRNEGEHPRRNEGEHPRRNEAERRRRISVDREGPLLIEGPVEVVADDGTVSVSDRFVVAVCTCRRSRTYPWCDTSHRGHRRPARPATPPREREGGGA